MTSRHSQECANHPYLVVFCVQDDNRHVTWLRNRNSDPVSESIKNQYLILQSYHPPSFFAHCGYGSELRPKQYALNDLFYIFCGLSDEPDLRSPVGIVFGKWLPIVVAWRGNSCFSATIFLESNTLH